VALLTVLQTSSAPQLSPFGSGPDLLLVLVVVLAVRRGAEPAAIAGFCGGLLLDAMLYAPLGVSSLLYVLAALAADRVPGERGSLSRMLVVVVGCAVLTQTGYAMLHALLGDGFPPGFVLRQVLLPTVALTGVAAIVLIPLLGRLFPTRGTIEGAAVAAA
jgi:rod shape-determining protein MreD